MSAAAVASARRIVARFATADASPVERVAWADALVDSGDAAAATGHLLALLRAGEAVPDRLLAVARRLTGEHARSVVTVAVDTGQAAARSTGMNPAPVAGALAHLAAGWDEAEEALLRAVLVVSRTTRIAPGPTTSGTGGTGSPRSCPCWPRRIAASRSGWTTGRGSSARPTVAG